jgi:hypothetical protein
VLVVAFAAGLLIWRARRRRRTTTLEADEILEDENDGGIGFRQRDEAQGDERDSR